VVAILRYASRMSLNFLTIIKIASPEIVGALKIANCPQDVEVVLAKIRRHVAAIGRRLVGLGNLHNRHTVASIPSVIVAPAPKQLIDGVQTTCENWAA
jgi:hypothetical protein